MPKGPSPSSWTEKLSPGLSWGLRGIRIPLFLEVRGEATWLDCLLGPEAPTQLRAFLTHMSSIMVPGVV